MSNDNTMNKFIQNPGYWNELGPYNDIVLSTNIVLCRNIYNVSFPHKQDENEISYINAVAKKFSEESEYKNKINLINLDIVSATDKKLLFERNSITSEMVNQENCSVISGIEENFNILINEDDHFKIQVNDPGLQVHEAYKIADRLDNELNKYAVYAYSEDLGYITSNPGNLGTGFSVSTLLHLPILSICKKIPDIIKMAQNNDLILSGIRDDGKKTFGNIYQLTNNSSIGSVEKKVLKTLNDKTLKIIDLECNARDEYISKHQNFLEDKIFRSLGILKYARKLEFAEVMGYLSDIRLGIILSIIKDFDLKKVNELMINSQWSHLEKIADRKFNDISECNNFRASYLREQLEWSSIYG